MTLSEEDADSLFKKPGYSPYAGRNFPTKLLWGDTHLHANNSLDTRAGGFTLGPEEAFRFARGGEVISTHGVPVKLSRPLDFHVVTDHSDAIGAIGAMNEIIKGNPTLMRDPVCKDWRDRIEQGGSVALAAAFEVIEEFAASRVKSSRRSWSTPRSRGPFGSDTSRLLRSTTTQVASRR